MVFCYIFFVDFGQDSVFGRMRIDFVLGSCNILFKVINNGETQCNQQFATNCPCIFLGETGSKKALRFIKCNLSSLNLWKMRIKWRRGVLHSNILLKVNNKYRAKVPDYFPGTISDCSIFFLYIFWASNFSWGKVEHDFQFLFEGVS